MTKDEFPSMLKHPCCERKINPQGEKDQQRQALCGKEPQSVCEAMSCAPLLITTDTWR